MSTLESLLLSAASAAGSQFWLDVAVKATALLLAASAANVLLRRSSAALRHRVWCLAFAALVLLPALSAALPEWRLAILPRVEEGKVASEAAIAATPAAAEIAEVSAALAPPAEPASFDPPARGEAMPDAFARALSPPPASFSAVSEEPPSALAAARQLPGLATMWFAGVGLALAPLAIGLARMFVLRRQSQAVACAAWTGLVDEVRARLGLARRVALLESRRAVMPMTWGLVRPTVLLPSQAREWSERLRRTVLLHELAHVKRCDVGFQLLGRLTCALYWFHPLAWYALRRLRIERELACDDCVVHSGELASDYAAELLQIARTYQPVRLAAAIAMAQRSSLEHRIRALFDRACSHLPVSARTARLLLVGVAIFVTTVAAIRLAPRAAAEDDAQTAGEEAKSADDDLVTVSGRILDPQGHPAAGAKVFAVRWYWEPHIPHPPLASTKSGVDGRFTIAYRKSQFNVDLGRPEQWKEAAIVATAEGAGPGWVTWRDIPPGAEPTLTLAADEPITGRIVDTEGRPVGGVAVRVGSIYSGKDGSLDGWLAAVRNGEFPWTAARHLDDSLPQFDAWPPRVESASNGRFRIAGLGRERRVELSFSGSTIAYQRAVVVTRKSETLQLKISAMSDESTPVYGADFEVVVPPTQAIVGVVRDATTREPLAGVSIESNRFAGSDYVNERHLLAVSDDQGRYRLVGMPKGKGNVLVAVPNDAQPYLMREVDVPESRGLEPVEVDIELHRGVWITGRVMDKATGKPLNARLYYLPFRTNEYAEKTPEFGELGRGHGFQERYVSQPDGSFRLVGLPGRAIVGALCVSGHYRDGVGAESIEGIDERGNFQTFLNPVTPGKKWPHAMKEINPPPDAESVICDLALDPGGKITVSMLDHDGNRLSGAEADGAKSSQDSPADRSSLDVINLGPDETRTVIIRHKQRKLGKVVRMGLADHPTGAATVSLEPTAKIVGRLLDANGEPISGAEITAWILPSGDFSKQLPWVATDEQGRFEYDDVPVGCHYRLHATGPGIRGQVADDLPVAAGETNDLGDVTLGGDMRTQKQPAADAETETAAASETPPAGEEAVARVNSNLGAAEVEFAGVVTDEDGKPLAGAEIWAAAPAADDRDLAARPSVRRLAESDRQGKFSFRLAPLGREESSDASWTSSVDVIAKAPGYGFDWLPLAVFEKSPAASPKRDELQQRVDKALGQGRFASCALKLPREAGPVQGRLIDLEGRPLADVTVSVETIQAPDLETLDRAFESSLRDLYYRAINGAFKSSQASRQAWQTLMPSVKTNQNGEFSFSGLGAGQLATVTLAGERAAAERLYIVGREMETKRLPHINLNGAKDVFFGVRFTHAVGPGRAVGGRVTEFRSGKPISGARVFVERLFRHDDGIDSAGRLRLDAYHIHDVTDAEGRFRLIGIPLGNGHVLNVVPPKSEPWLMAEQEFSLDADGTKTEAIVNVQVCRGIWIEGRLTDSATDEPVPGYVDYLALQKNPYTPEKLGLHEAWDLHRFPTGLSGRYRVAGLPGPGVLLVRARSETVYPLCVGAERVDGYDARYKYLPTTPTGLPLSNWNLIRQINPPADSKSYLLDLTLSAGVTLTGRVAGPGGESPRPVEAMGLVEKDPFFRPLEGDRFSVYAYEPDVGRDVFFRSAGNSRVAHLHLAGKPPAEMTVLLEAAVTVKGRLIETETEVEAVGYSLFCESTKQGEFRIDDALTDENGRFEIKGLLAGNVYRMDAANPRHFVNQKNGFTVDLSGAKPGDVIELGDVTGPAAKGNPQAEKGSQSPDRKVQGPGATGNMKKDSPVRAIKAKVVRGRVMRDGRPASGADVAVIARKTAAVRGGDYSPSGEVVAEGKTDGNGDYSLNFADASAKSHAYAKIIARQEGAAIAWQQLNLEAVDSKIDLELPAEEPVRGRVIELEGQPAAGVRLTVRGIADPSKSGEGGGVGYQGEQAPAAWLAPVVSDEQGRFVIHGAPAAHGVYMEVGPDERFAPQEIDLSPGADEQRGARDATYRPLVKNLKAGEEVLLTLSPAQPFAGTVRYADSGKPAPHARISIWASQQERFGSMISVGGRADENGRYQISPKPGVRFGLTAYPPDGAPYLARQTSRDEPLRWNAAEGVKQVDLSLPRGVLVQGRVVVTGTAAPVANATVQYIPETSNNPDASKDVLTGWQAIQLSDKEGRFSIAVLPGPGRLLVSGQQGNYVLQQISELELSDGKPGGARNYAHAIAKLNPEVGQETLEVKLELQPGATVSGRIVDEQGQGIEEATVISRLNISPYSLFWRGHTTPTLGGRFELTGLAGDTEYPVYFLDPKRRLGATEIIKAGEGERTVILKPCGQARLRAVDKSGEPGADHVSVEMVVTPGALRYDFEAVRNGELAADADYIANIDRTNHWNRPQSDEKGHFVLPALIPGATYRVITGRGGTLKVVKEFQVQSNETLDLGEILIERIE